MEFNKAEKFQCYEKAGGWNEAYKKVFDFIDFSLNLCKPFVFALMIMGISYLVIIFMILGCMNVREIYLLMPPY